MKGGYLTLFHFRGIPVRGHWTILLVPLLFGLGANMWRTPAYWLAILFLIAWHEAGHAFLVRRYKHEVISIDLHGFGGACVWHGNATPWQRAAIAWGGVLAQATLFPLAGLLAASSWAATSPSVKAIIYAWTIPNALIIAFNLIPIQPLDGGTAWALLPMAWRRWRRRRPPRPPKEVDYDKIPKEIRNEVDRVLDEVSEEVAKRKADAD